MDIELLKGIRIFSKLDDRSLRALGGVLQLQRYEDSDVIIHQGSISDGIYIILDGSIRVSHRTSTGAIIVLNTLENGSVFGTLSTIDSGVRGAKCMAVGATQVAYMTKVDFLELMDSTSAFALSFQVAILRSIFFDIRRTNDQLAELASLDPCRELISL